VGEVKKYRDASEISGIQEDGWRISIVPPAAAECYFKRHMIFAISLREIAKIMCLPKENLARRAKKKLLHNPCQNIIWRFAPNNNL
jgi:hypothetical protein